MRLERAWQCNSIGQPGNILVLHPAGEQLTPRIFVVSGWRAVVELDLNGTVVARHDLPIDERATIGFIRSEIDSEGRRYFAVSGISQQLVHLFDERWNRILSFPSEQHPGIADVRLADLEGKGELQTIIGYWDVVGVQGVSLAGERIWSNRSLQNALQLAVTGPNELGQRRILCVNSRGTIVPIDHEGKQLPDITVAQRAIIHLAAADLNADGQFELCALAALGVGKRVALGLDEQGRELWQYELPDGVHQKQIEPIVAAKLGATDGGWLLPGADGSIHFLTPDGQLVDRFHYGSALSGLALVDGSDGPLLIVSSGDSVTGWQVHLETP
jgi:hypothetical protein